LEVVACLQNGPTKPVDEIYAAVSGIDLDDLSGLWLKEEQFRIHISSSHVNQAGFRDLSGNYFFA